MRRTKTLNNEKGAAAVEFAIVLIPLLLILFGTIEFGLLMYNTQVITNASREGARAGIIAAATPLDEQGISAIVNNYTSARLVTFGAQNTPTVNLGTDGTCDNFGDELGVTVTYKYTFLLIPSFSGIPNSTNIAATTKMKCE